MADMTGFSFFCGTDMLYSSNEWKRIIDDAKQGGTFYVARYAKKMDGEYLGVDAKPEDTKPEDTKPED